MEETERTVLDEPVDVVVVEDNVVLLANYVESLTHAGMSVVGCAGITDAKVKIQLGQPRVVVVDLALNYVPRAGHELCRWVNEHHPDLRMIVHTSSSDDADRRIASQNNVTEYLVKSPDLERLVERALKYCSESEEA